MEAYAFVLLTDWVMNMCGIKNIPIITHARCSPNLKAKVQTILDILIVGIWISEAKIGI
jgi:hypothetical protein